MTSHPDAPAGRFRPELSRRQLLESTASLGAAIALGGLSTAAATPSRDPLFQSASTLARSIRERALSAKEAVLRCLATIESVNPRINALATVCRERALAEAAAADEALALGKSKGPLHGVPFTMSDAFDAAEVVSTAGTLGRRQFVPAADATVVARLRAAGAILLGKSNTAELSFGGPAHVTTNLVFGTTRNPYDVQREAGGGSGGAGAIVASGASAFDIATDLSGAIREPCVASGLAGLKPTFGRLPRTGHILGYGGAFDAFVELGPLARYVEDLALLLPILCGPDDSDAATVPVPLGDPARVDLRALRIAHHGAERDGAVASAVARFRSSGAKAVADAPPALADFDELRAEYLAGDGGEHVRRLLTKLGSARSTPGLDERTPGVPSPEFSRLREELDAIRARQLEWVERYDLLVCPSDSTAPSGWPAGVVRVGTTGDGMPVTVQLAAQPWREDVLIAAMRHLEAGNGWQAPANAGVHG